MNERINELSLCYGCVYCLAGVGIWCRTRSGAVATHLHSMRSDPVRLAWLAGRDEGFEFARRAPLVSVSAASGGPSNTWTG